VTLKSDQSKVYEVCSDQSKVYVQQWTLDGLITHTNSCIIASTFNYEQTYGI